MDTVYFDAEAKAGLRSEAVKLVARYDSPLETVKALMAYNCELETQPGIVSIGYDDAPPVGG
ncbi:hypothetical protein NKI38_33170 [Mesorhizobium sp. M0621]|uniref:hypothetical protein n=1 Tax=Mesorhizobium sp. M0621 TaxID=2956974 RepID=UPI0033385832